MLIERPSLLTFPKLRRELKLRHVAEFLTSRVNIHDNVSGLFKFANLASSSVLDKNPNHLFQFLEVNYLNHPLLGAYQSVDYTQDCVSPNFQIFREKIFKSDTYIHLSKHFNTELLEVIFGAHLRKHLRLLVGYRETSVAGSHAMRV